MSDPELDSQVLDRVPMARRAFVKKVVIGTAFVAPVVASFSMDSLTMKTAYAQIQNQVSLSP